ncbi:MAG: type II toxin-antitoxin system VapC family toxin [Nitrospirae bacterium]|nr:type II toxin-antitoxin system VapC family toxin [Nitrospirota bacterium]
MVYLDTSIVAPLILPEPASERIESLVRRIPVGDLAVSHWTRVEFAGLLARRVRMKELARAQASRAISAFEDLLAASFHVIPPDVADFDLAVRFLERYDSGLRSGDALHLAIAQNHEARRFYTLDAKLAKAAGALNIPVHLPV